MFTTFEHPTKIYFERYLDILSLSLIQVPKTRKHLKKRKINICFKIEHEGFKKISFSNADYFNVICMLTKSTQNKFKKLIIDTNLDHSIFMWNFFIRINLGF